MKKNLLLLIIFIIFSCYQNIEKKTPYIVPYLLNNDEYDFENEIKYNHYLWTITNKKNDVYIMMYFGENPDTELPKAKKSKNGKIAQQNIKWWNYDDLNYTSYKYYRKATFKSQNTREYSSLWVDIILYGDNLDEIENMQIMLEFLELQIKKEFIPEK